VGATKNLHLPHENPSNNSHNRTATIPRFVAYLVIRFMIEFDRPICIYAIQTTGQDSAKDRIIEISVHKLLSLREVERKHWILNPGIRISDQSTNFHGITNEMVHGKPRFEDVYQDIWDFMKGTYWTGYNVEFMYNKFLVFSLIRSGLEITSSDINYIDIGNIYKKFNPRTLESCFESYTGQSLHMDNRSETAANAVVHIFASMIHEHGDEIGSDTESWEYISTNKRSLVDFDRRFIRNKNGVIEFNFGTKRGIAASSQPDTLRWMLSNKFSKETKNWARRILESSGEL